MMRLGRRSRGGCRGASDVLYYGDLAPDLDLNMDNPQHRIRIGELLGEISIHEVKAGWPPDAVVRGGPAG